MGEAEKKKIKKKRGEGGPGEFRNPRNVRPQGQSSQKIKLNKKILEKRRKFKKKKKVGKSPREKKMDFSMEKKKN